MVQEDTFHCKRWNKPECKAYAGKEKNMKKHRKLISLILAIVMMSTLLAMSASAATTEVQPRGTCPSCTYGYLSTSVVNLDSDPYDNTYTLTTCSKMGAKHAHYDMPKKATVTCSNCSYYDTYTYTGKYCPYGGV